MRVGNAEKLDRVFFIALLVGGIHVMLSNPYLHGYTLHSVKTYIIS